MATDEAFFKNILDNIEDGVYFVDRRRNITYWSKGAEYITGYKGSEVVGKNCANNILMHVDDMGVELCKNGCPLEAAMSEGITKQAEVYLHHKNGHRVPVLVRAVPIKDSTGLVVGAVETFTENAAKDELIQKINELQRLSLLDSLTEIGNRRFAEMDVNSRFNKLVRYGLAFGLLFIDIDHFKAVNDTYGHVTGDKILKMVAKTLLNATRSFDSVARWGGEEFVAAIENVSREELYSIANRYRLLVEQSSLRREQNTVRVTISVGATIALPDDTMETLLKRADELMYQSKITGRNIVSLG